MIKVNKGILQTYKKNEKQFTASNGLKFSRVDINNNQLAINLFEFFAENTIVEFSHVKFDKTGNVITTTHGPLSESGGNTVAYDLITKHNAQIREMIHSHPTDGNPSPADTKGAAYWKNFPGQNIILKIYRTISKQYTPY